MRQSVTGTTVILGYIAVVSLLVFSPAVRLAFRVDFILALGAGGLYIAGSIVEYWLQKRERRQAQAAAQHDEWETVAEGDDEWETIAQFPPRPRPRTL